MKEASYRILFKEFLFLQLGIEKRVIEQLFDFVSKPHNGGQTWVAKSHRRMTELQSSCVQAFVRKIKTSANDGHGCYACLSGNSSMGTEGFFVREITGNPGCVISFLGMAKPILGSDVRYSLYKNLPYNKKSICIHYFIHI